MKACSDQTDGQCKMTIGNFLIASLPKDELERLRPSLSSIPLKRQIRLIQANEPSKYAYFPESGIISVISSAGDSHRQLVGIYGHEGAGGLAAILGVPSSPSYELVEVAGRAHRLAAEDLHHAMQFLPEFRKRLLRYTHIFMVQMSSALLASNARIEQRLARYLLMCQDRIHEPILPLTHLSLSEMLGVRRSGITEAMHVLEGNELIRTRRGFICIADRGGLETLAAGIYGQAETEYYRFMEEITPKPAVGQLSQGAMRASG